MFFARTAVVMLVGVLVGFAPTFFLRSVYVPLPLPGLLVAHGVVMTTWSLLMVAQAYLAETRRLRWHRPLGWAGAAVAGFVILSSLPVIVRSVAAGVSAGIPTVAVSLVFLTGMFRVAFFAVMVGVGIWFRRRRAVHARALFMASLSNLAPAMSRLATMLGSSVFVVTFLYLVPFGAALVWHDRRTLLRVHPITVFGLAALVLIPLLSIGLLLAGASDVIVARFG